MLSISLSPLPRRDSPVVGALVSHHGAQFRAGSTGHSGDCVELMASGSQRINSSLRELGVFGFFGSQDPGHIFFSFPKSPRTIPLIGWIPGSCTPFSQGNFHGPHSEDSGLNLLVYSQVLLTSPASTPSSYPALKQHGRHLRYPGPSPDVLKGVGRLNWLPGAHFIPSPCCH